MGECIQVDSTDWAVVAAVAGVTALWGIHHKRQVFKRQIGWVINALTILTLLAVPVYIFQRVTHGEAKADLRFVAPFDGQDVDRIVPVTLRGSVPSGEQVWIVVQSEGRYYLQGRAEGRGPSRDTWFLAGVTLGSENDLADKNAAYKILGVRASPGTDADLERMLSGTTDSGITDLPGGIPANSPSVTVNRKG